MADPDRLDLGDIDLEPQLTSDEREPDGDPEADETFNRRDEQLRQDRPPHHRP